MPKVSVFIRTELLLYALLTYFPHQPIEKAHWLLQGYREPGITNDQWHILTHLRHLASEFQSSISWELALRAYDELAESPISSWLGFDIDYDANTITPTRNRVLERYTTYERVLTEDPLHFLTQEYKPAPVGEYTFNLNPKLQRNIRIPATLASIGASYVSSVPNIDTSSSCDSIQVELTDLFAQGTALQSQIGYDAGAVLQQSVYRDIQNDEIATAICINGQAHILGPTGSGKSTLIDCLVALLIERGKRVAIATNSVGEVQDWLEFAQKIGIRAVPVIGESERHKHLSRLNQAVMFSNSQQPFTHPGFRWLSQACPLYALADPSIPQPAEGQRSRPPCFQKLQDKAEKKFDCPLVPICPRHINADELKEAQLIVGTLPGFIHKRVASHDLAENLTMLEYLALTTDLFIIDEVDLAQPKLDEIFYPTVALASFKTVDTWTRTEAHQHVTGPLEGEVVVPGVLNDPYLEYSEDQRHLANRSIGALMYLIRNIAESLKGKSSKQAIERLLQAYTREGRIFSAWTLFDKLAKHLSGLAHVERSVHKVRQQTVNKRERSYERYRELFKRVQDNLVQPDLTGLESADRRLVESLARVSGVLLAGDLLTAVPHPYCEDFILTTRWDTDLATLEPTSTDSDCFIINLATLLQLAIYSAHVLGALGKHISARQRADLSLESTLPITPPRDFNGLLPNSPVGSVTSAQFTQGHLNIFRGIAVGRALLSQWYSIFNVDGMTPANLLLTSATSYSGTQAQSYPFHVQLPPTLLIEPPSRKRKAVAQDSEFFYCPVSDDAGNPVFISGSQGERRTENIGHMVSGLCRSPKHSKALIDLFQDYLETSFGADRKNLLLVTNSYAEAETFYNVLKHPYQDKASYVVADGQWKSHDQVARSKLTEFPDGGKELLIAPMGAISRAVNLMHPNSGEPYFGGIVIVVRQHPRPDDNQVVVSAVNKETIDIMGRRAVEVTQRRARQVRDVVLEVPQIFSNLPDSIADIALKDPLVWTLAVNLTQLIGRSTRGGRPTVIWFTDAAFMPNTAKGDPASDTEKNSVIRAVRTLLGDAISKGGESSPIIETLYGPIYHPLNRLTHFVTGVKL
ncbi:hypothetical protein [Acaryochloris sp. CCMEE 5410]|uniref:pPIWI_RE_Z domain-containing protein n=1 Tax=Acaryochloris sp. CCMEE 5410 TaxID=310037 RepID=UPI0002E5B346|nr:hypothetical protein [Acaryochloris sp. CCMEE 5410]